MARRNPAQPKRPAAAPPAKRPPPERAGRGRAPHRGRDEGGAGGGGGGGASDDVKQGDLYLGGATVSDVLLAELTALGAVHPIAIADGVVVASSTTPPRLIDPAFALQVMPAAARSREANANSLAAAMLDAAVASGDGALPDVAEVVLPEMARRGSRALVEEDHPLAAAAAELEDVLQKKIEGRRAKQGVTEASGSKLRVLLVDTWAAWRTIEKVD